MTHSSIDAVATGHESDVASDRECMTGIGLYDSGSLAIKELNVFRMSSGAGEFEIAKYVCGVPVILSTRHGFYVINCHLRSQ